MLDTPHGPDKGGVAEAHQLRTAGCSTTSRGPRWTSTSSARCTGVSRQRRRAGGRPPVWLRKAARPDLAPCGDAARLLGYEGGTGLVAESDNRRERWRHRPRSGHEPAARCSEREAGCRDRSPAQRSPLDPLPQPVPVVLEGGEQPAPPHELFRPQPDAGQDGGHGCQHRQQPQGSAGKHDRQAGEEHTAAVAAVQARPAPQPCPPATVRDADISGTGIRCGRRHDHALKCSTAARCPACTPHIPTSRLCPPSWMTTTRVLRRGQRDITHSP